MDKETYLAPLKLKLQNLGALRPEAWLKITESMMVTRLQINDRFIRSQGDFAYIATGLLIEYNPTERKRPAIINFLTSGQCFLNRKFNQEHYLLASMPSVVYYWQTADLQNLHQEFNELKNIYDALVATYDEAIAYRQFILEEKFVAKQIELFINHNRELLPYLKKKDMANYLGQGYDYFIKQYNLYLNNNGNK